MDKHLEPEDLFFVLSYEPKRKIGPFVEEGKLRGFEWIIAPSGRTISFNRETQEWTYLGHD